MPGRIAPTAGFMGTPARARVFRLLALGSLRRLVKADTPEASKGALIAMAAVLGMVTFVLTLPRTYVEARGVLEVAGESGLYVALGTTGLFSLFGGGVVLGWVFASAGLGYDLMAEPIRNLRAPLRGAVLPLLALLLMVPIMSSMVVAVVGGIYASVLPGAAPTSTLGVSVALLTTLTIGALFAVWLVVVLQSRLSGLLLNLGMLVAGVLMLVIILLLTYGGSLMGGQGTASNLSESVGRALVEHGAILSLVGLGGVVASTVATRNALERWLRGPPITPPKERPHAWTAIVPRASQLRGIGLGVALARHEYFAFLRQWERLIPASAAGLGLAMLPGILRAIVGEVGPPQGAGEAVYLAFSIYLLPLAIAITCAAYAESVFPPRNALPIFALSPGPWNVSNMVRFVVLSTCTALVFAPVVLGYLVFFEEATGWLAAVAAASVVALSLMACALQLRAGVWDHGHPRMTLAGRAGMVVSGLALGAACAGIFLLGHGVGRVGGLTGALSLAILIAAGTFWSASRTFLEVRR